MALKQDSIGREISASVSGWLCSVLGLALLLSLSGCSQEAADSAKEAVEKTGEAVKKTAEDAEEAVSEGAEEAGKMAEEAGEKLSEGFNAATNKASEALEGVEGGSELLANMKEFFSSAKETLQGIADNESTEKALSKLGDLDGMAESLSESISELPGEAKTAVDGAMASGAKMLKALIEKIKAMPSVEPTVKAKLDQLSEKLDSFADTTEKK